MMLNVPLCVVKIIFTGVETAPYYALCFSFTNINQVFSKFLSLSRPGGQISKVQPGVLAISKGCNLHFPLLKIVSVQEYDSAPQPRVSKMQRYHCHKAVLQFSGCNSHMATNRH